jgi:hypothetical protein
MTKLSLFNKNKIITASKQQMFSKRHETFENLQWETKSFQDLKLSYQDKFDKIVQKHEKICIKKHINSCLKL